MPTKWHAFIVCGIQLIQGNNEKRRNLKAGCITRFTKFLFIIFLIYFYNKTRSIRFTLKTQDSDENDSDEENDDFETLAIEEEPGSHEAETDELLILIKLKIFLL